MTKDSVVALDPASRRCVAIGAGTANYLKELFDKGLILVPAACADAITALHEKHDDVYQLNSNASIYPKAVASSIPDLQARIYAAVVAVAYKGDIGLSGRTNLMYPCSDLSRDSCLRYAMFLLSRLMTVSLEALPAERSAQIQQELAEQLSSNFEAE